MENSGYVTTSDGSPYIKRRIIVVEARVTPIHSGFLLLTCQIVARSFTRSASDPFSRERRRRSVRALITIITPRTRTALPLAALITMIRACYSIRHTERSPYRTVTSDTGFAIIFTHKRLRLLVIWRCCSTSCVML